MGPKVLYFEDAHEDDEAPTLVTPQITRTHIVRYAGASGDFNPIHTDEICAIRAGNDRVFAMGMMTAGFLSHMITDWLGNGALRKYGIRFVARVWPGDTITCKGRIVKKYTDGKRKFIKADVHAENQNAQKVITGSILAELPSRNE